MINGLNHDQLVLSILLDGKPHYSREFVDAGLLEYRRRVSDLREKDWVVNSLRLNKRPAYQLMGKKSEMNKDLFDGL